MFLMLSLLRELLCVLWIFLGFVEKWSEGCEGFLFRGENDKASGLAFCGSRVKTAGG